MIRRAQPWPACRSSRSRSRSSAWPSRRCSQSIISALLHARVSEARVCASAACGDTGASGGGGGGGGCCCCAAGASLCVRACGVAPYEEAALLEAEAGAEAEAEGPGELKESVRRLRAAHEASDRLHFAGGAPPRAAAPADVSVDVLPSPQASSSAGALSPRTAGLLATIETILAERRASRATPMTVPGTVVHLALRRRRAGWCARGGGELWEVRREAAAASRAEALGEILIGEEMVLDHLPHVVWRRLALAEAAVAGAAR